MKTVLSWIRWKYFIPVAILVTAIVIFFVVFFDPLLARAIESVGSKINGAKVDVDGLKTKFFKGRIDIGRFQVADKDLPMQNVVEAGPLAFQISPIDMFSKRVIIHDATLKGLAFETKRKTSGALPLKAAKRVDKDKEPSAASRLVDKYQQRFKLNIDGLKGEVKKRIEFDPKELELVKTADMLKTQAKQMPDQWKNRVNDLDVENRLKKAEAEITALKATPTKGPDAITAIPNALKKVGQVKSDLEQLKKDVEAAKTATVADVKAVKSGIARLPEAKKRDVDNIMSRLNLDFLSPSRLVEGLIGPVVIQRVKTVMHYVELARKNMPSKSQKDLLPPKPRAKGMDIAFPTPAAPPTFWLKKAVLEGAYHGIAAAGSLSNATSDPSKIGLPFKIALAGEQNARKFSANGVFDHTTDISKDSLSLAASGLDLASLLAADGSGADFSQGTARINLDLALLGESNISGTLGLGLSELKFAEGALFRKVGIDSAAASSTEDKIKADFITNVGNAIEGMKEVAVTAGITGTWQDPEIKLNSNLAPVLTSVIKTSVGSALGEQRQELESRVNAILSEKTAELNKEVSTLETSVNAEINEMQAKIQSKINEATGINLTSVGGQSGIKVPGLDKLFKK
jgi:uncharacterized protein (TIGR03545 family)